MFIFDRIDGFLWTRELQVPLRDMVHLSVRPYLRPLAEAMDEFPHYAVAVVEKDAVRLFTVGLGDIEESSRPSIGIELPVAVQTDKVNASFRNGVLEIRLPKTEEAKKNVVKVKVA